MPILEDERWYVIDSATNRVSTGLGGFDCYFDAAYAGREAHQAHIVMKGKYIKADSRWSA